MSRIVAATGHRPSKLGGYGVQARAGLVRLAMEGLCSIRTDETIVGMALGWDTAVAIACHTLNIPYIAAIPFLGQERMWPKESQELYNFLLEHAKDVVYVSQAGYEPWKMQARNEFMVNTCSHVMALWDGSRGGTGNCIAYANKVGKPITNLWDAYNNNKE